MGEAKRRRELGLPPRHTGHGQSAVPVYTPVPTMLAVQMAEASLAALSEGRPMAEVVEAGLAMLPEGSTEQTRRGAKKRIEALLGAELQRRMNRRAKEKSDGDRT